MQIGERILARRKELGLSRKGLSEKTNGAVSETSIKQYETGRRQPRVGLLQQLAFALGVDMNYLLNGTHTIGQRLKDRREALDMTQEQLAEKSGYDLKTIIDRENDAIVSDNDMIERLAVALDCSAVYLRYAGGGPELDKIYGPHMTTDDVLDSPEVLKGTISNHFDVLNGKGQKEAVKRVRELTMIDEYTE